MLLTLANAYSIAGCVGYGYPTFDFADAADEVTLQEGSKVSGFYYFKSN